MKRQKVYVLALANGLILTLWVAAMVFVFRPISGTPKEPELPNIGSLAVEQLGQRLRISFVSYLNILDLVLPGVDAVDSAATPAWFAKSFAASPIQTPDGPCEWDTPGWSYKDARLSMQVLAYCPGSLPSWRWDLNFLLGPLSHGRLQLILVDEGTSETVELSGRQLHFKIRRLTVAAADSPDQEG